MAELTLKPYAAVQRWTIHQAGLAPEGLLKEYLETLAKKCQASENAVIGHIKALALFPEGNYLRVSVVAAHLPATIDGTTPPDCAELEITLNVLVYGLHAGQAEQLSQAAASVLMHRQPVTIEIVPTHHTGAAAHIHNHE